VVNSIYFLSLIGVAFTFFPIGFYIANRKIIRNINSNVFVLGLVSFLMQLSSTFIHSSSLHVMSKHVFSPKIFVLIKNASEAVSGGVKLISSYITDVVKSQRPLLMIGYGTMPIFKLAFAVCTLSEILPAKIWGLTTSYLIGGLFVFSHVMDRVFAGARDGTRNKILSNAIDENNKYIVFGIRKYLGSLGSVLGASITYYVLTHKHSLDIIPPAILSSISKLYFLSIVPLMFLVPILYFKIRENHKTVNAENSQVVGKVSYWIYGFIAIITLPLASYVAPIFFQFLYGLINTHLGFVAAIEYSKVIGLLGLSFVTYISVQFSSLASLTITCVYIILFNGIFGALYDNISLFVTVYMWSKANKQAVLEKNTKSFVIMLVGFLLHLLYCVGSYWITVPSVIYIGSYGIVTTSIISCFHDVLLLMGIINTAYYILQKIKSSNLPISHVIAIWLMNLRNFNVFAVWSFSPILMNFKILCSYIIGFICLTQFDIMISTTCSMFFLFILNKIDYEYIVTSLAKNKGKNRPFLQLMTVGIIIAFARINDMIFIASFGETRLFGDAFSPMIFGLLYVWIAVFSLIHGSLMQRGYRKLLIGMVIISLLACNILLSFNLYDDNFIIMNFILFLLGFASAGEESVLVTLLRDRIPDPNLFGMYFGIFDSSMAIAKLLGMVAINVVWMNFGTSIVMAGRFCSIMMIMGLILLFVFSRNLDSLKTEKQIA
jgi:hypothetical protein